VSIASDSLCVQFDFTRTITSHVMMCSDAIIPVPHVISTSSSHPRIPLCTKMKYHNAIISLLNKPIASSIVRNTTSKREFNQQTKEGRRHSPRCHPKFSCVSNSKIILPSFCSQVPGPLDQQYSSLAPTTLHRRIHIYRLFSLCYFRCSSFLEFYTLSWWM
jgi:hypothetical protein